MVAMRARSNRRTVGGGAVWGRPTGVIVTNVQKLDGINKRLNKRRQDAGYPECPRCHKHIKHPENWHYSDAPMKKVCK